MIRLAGRFSLFLGAAALASGLCAAGPAAAGAATGPAAGAATGRAAAAVTSAAPAGFKAASITWLSPEQGWVLGTAPCGTKTCTDVVGTTSGGRTWGLLGTINAAVPILGLGGTGVTQIRFATPELGWAFGPGLYVTRNGGRSWAPVTIPGQGRQILDLATSRTGAYAIVSPCALDAGLCSSGPLSFWRTTTSSGSGWTQVPLRLPISVAAVVAAYHHTIYVVDEGAGQAGPPKDEFYASTDSGQRFSTRPDPCEKTADVGIADVTPVSPTRVGLLCVGQPGMSQALKSVYRSATTGRTDTYAGTMGLYGIQSELAMSPSGNLAVASVSDGSFIYVNDTGKTTWTMVIGYGDGGAGWSDITYVTDSEAWVVYAPADTFADLGKVFVTHNAGRLWEVAGL